MRSEQEIQQAHDLLGAIAVGEIPYPLDEDTRRRMMRMVTVLCWVLEHEHNPTFGEELAHIMARIKR